MAAATRPAASSTDSIIVAMIGHILNNPLALIARAITWQQASGCWMRGFHAIHRPYAWHSEFVNKSYLTP